jgi:hypothetical protein
MSRSPAISDSQPHSSEDIELRTITSHPALQDPWTQPPQSLHGPDNHPFFNTFAPNAYGIASRLVSDQAKCSASANCDTETPAEEPMFGTPLVYPFVPAPSLSMEPMTPDIDSATTLSESPEASHSQHSTPSFSFSNPAHDSSPESRPSTAEGYWTIDMPKNIKDTDVHLTKPKEQEVTPPAKATNQKSAQECSEKMEVDAICILTYMRTIPNSETNESAVIANGQIWQSANKKGWRRNQWVVDVR